MWRSVFAIPRCLSFVSSRLSSRIHNSFAASTSGLSPWLPSISIDEYSSGSSVVYSSLSTLHSTTAPTRHEPSYPGAHSTIQFTNSAQFTPARGEGPIIPCFRLLDFNGKLVSDTLSSEGSAVQLVTSENELPERDFSLRMYLAMMRLQTLDNYFYEAQRQGRFSFYLTTSGEEATNIGSAAALNDKKDVVFAQYREAGVLLWRGFSYSDFSNQCFGNEKDLGKGRQMPIHYGSREHNFHTISSTLATQLPHAVGAAYSLKMDAMNGEYSTDEKGITVAYFGDGASSEGDFHAAMNFAAVLECPTLFFCRNNGWAISTPVEQQFRGDGVAGKGPAAYGVPSIRVDGNDVLAVYMATKEARKYILEHSTPVLVEALTYRAGHHSTSDDSSRYRTPNEISFWKSRRDPVERFKNYLMQKEWWNAEEDVEAREQAKREVIQALDAAEKLRKPNLQELFTDVYDVPTWNLKEQKAMVEDAVQKYPASYPSDVPLSTI